MRITQSMYFKNIYGENNTQLGKKLFDVNKQIASGVKIQYAKDDIQTFTDTMRLDNEITILKQIKSSTDTGLKISDQSDVVLTEFEDKLAEIGPLLIKAANDTNSAESLDAIAKELRGLEVNLKDLANTSINGKYLFSGSLVETRPISEDGTYNGNDAELNAFTGSRVSQQFNISGAELFLGENSRSPREITTNVVQQSNVGTTLDGNTTMADYNGTSVSNQHYFYLRGAKSDGTAFNTKIQLNNADTVDDLLNAIGVAYGNGATDVVNVSMNGQGQIVIEDKIKGSSKLDFHMVGATDLGGADDADVNDIDDLGVNGGLTDYTLALGSASQLYVREYVKSSLTSADSVPGGNTIEGTIYDRTEFTRDASKLTSNVPQILKRSYVDSNGDETISKSDVNAFATASTTISQVADLSQGTAGTLDGTTLVLEGTDIGGAAYSAQIDFATAGSTFTVGGNTYDIFDVGTPRAAVAADDMTYQQLMDVMNMVVTGSLPAAAPGTDAQYDTAVESSNILGRTTLTYDGKIEFTDLGSTTTQASIAMYDQNSDNFTTDASVMTFNTNNSLTVRDPKSDFFKTLDEIITSVEEYKKYPDASSGNTRNVGMEHALAMAEDLQDQIGRAHSVVGAQSNALTDSLERTSLLELSTATLRSNVIDTDLAEASLTLTQLTLNYEAMLSTVGKVSQLSLVNYL